MTDGRSSSSPEGPAVERVDQVTDEIVEALAALLPQLGVVPLAPTQQTVRELVATPGSHLLVARDASGAIIGTLTLLRHLRMLGPVGWIEDVVVDERARGQGAGSALLREAIRIATEEAIPQLRLTSRNSRAGAHRLYRGEGFTVKETTVFNLELKP